MEDEHDYVADDTNLRDIKDAIEALGDQLEQINESLKEKSDVGGSVWAAIVVFLVIIAPGSWEGSNLDRFTDRVWYSQKYDADWAHTDIQRRPTDCDFCALQSEPNAAPTQSRQMYSRTKSDNLLSH